MNLSSDILPGNSVIRNSHRHLVLSVRRPVHSGNTPPAQGHQRNKGRQGEGEKH